MTSFYMVSNLVHCISCLLRQGFRFRCNFDRNNSSGAIDLYCEIASVEFDEQWLDCQTFQTKPFPPSSLISSYVIIMMHVYINPPITLVLLIAQI